MNKHSRTVWIAVSAIAGVVALGYGVYDYMRANRGIVDCGTYSHPRIDIRDFVQRYSAYALELEGELGGQTFSAVFRPTQLQELTAASQQSNEFRKFVVAGYNGCAITPSQYGDLGTRFQALDGVAQQIQALVAEGAEADTTTLHRLVEEYVTMTREITSR